MDIFSIEVLINLSITGKISIADRKPDTWLEI